MKTVIRFFDLLFYLLYTIYSNKEKAAVSTSAAIIGGVQAFNLLTVIMLVAYLTSPKTYFSKIFAIAVALVFQVISHIRYSNEKFVMKGEEKWQGMDNATKTRIRAISFLYILLSFASFIGLNIYWGNFRH